MRLSEFDRAVADEFGSQGPALVADLALAGLGNRTAQEGLRDGVPTREVWFALCVETDVPASRRHGAGRLEPKDR